MKAIGIIRTLAACVTAACVTVTTMLAGQASAQPVSISKDPLFGQLSSADAISGSNEAACEKGAPMLDPTLSEAWLLEPAAPAGKPELVIGRYDLTQGLMAGYQAASGRRILLHAIWLPNGRVAASATHVNPQTGRLKTFYGPRKLVDPSSGNATAHVQFAGVDVMKYLKDARKRTPAPRADAVNEFIDSESGQAFFEAMPVLYAMLETLDDDPRLAALQAPFGVLTTLLQIATTKYAGFPQADAVLGRGHANALRQDCHGRTCAFRGKQFKVHNNGLFDAVSKSKSPKDKSASEQCAGGGAGAGPIPGIEATLKNGSGVCDNPGPCFGRCGRSCDGQPWLGHIYTPACANHDLCVCTWGDASCIFFDAWHSPCAGCGDLYDAGLSWFGGMFSWLTDWVSAWFTGVWDTLVNWF